MVYTDGLVPRQRFFNLPPKARSRLLAIATRHFAEHGLEGASLNEILAEAGLSKGSYYYYFDDKDDLFATALEHALDATFAKLPMPAFDELTAEQFWPTVERFVGQWASAFDVSSDLFQVALKLSQTQRNSPRFAPMLAKGQAIYRALLEPGRRLGCIRTDLSVDALVRLLEANDAVLDSIFLSTHQTVTSESVDQHVQLVFDTFKRLLIADTGRASPRRVHAKRRSTIARKPARKRHA